MNDRQIDGDANVTVTASASGFNNGVGVLDVLDANIPTMELSLTSSTVTQSSGVGATMGTITLDVPANREITVALSSDNASVATVPAEVYVQAGQTSTTFPINAINNGLEISVINTPTSPPHSSPWRAATLSNDSVTAELTVVDSNGPALSISLPVAAISAKAAQPSPPSPATRTQARSSPAAAKQQHNARHRASFAGDQRRPGFGNVYDHGCGRPACRR